MEVGAIIAKRKAPIIPTLDLAGFKSAAGLPPHRTERKTSETHYLRRGVARADARGARWPRARSQRPLPCRHPLDQRHHASRSPTQIRRGKPKEMSSLGAPSHIDADYNDCGAVGAVRASLNGSHKTGEIIASRIAARKTRVSAKAFHRNYQSKIQRTVRSRAE